MPVHTPAHMMQKRRIEDEEYNDNSTLPAKKYHSIHPAGGIRGPKH